MYIMKEDTLTQIKNEVEITKLNIEKNNTMLKRIKELEKNRYVREYLNLVGFLILSKNLLLILMMR